MKELPILPTTVVGSHGHAGWWHEGKTAFEAGKWGPYDVEEMFNDAADIAILDQERAGVDIITDGEARRLDGYVDTYYSIIDGLRPIPSPRPWRARPWQATPARRAMSRRGPRAPAPSSTACR